MPRLPLFRLGGLLGALLVIAPSSLPAGQSPSAAARIRAAIYGGQRIVLPGSTTPLAQPRYDQGSAPAALPLNRMIMVLRPSPQQEADLQQFLQAQQRRGDPQYHHWLTPAQFGARFGVDAADRATIAAWLQSRGFTPGPSSPGGNEIEFSGAAAQLAAAFGAAMHHYVVSGQDYYANANDPSVPAALAPVVAGFLSLNNFPKRISPQPTYLASPAGSSGQMIAPGDFAVLYNLNPLYQAGINGTGESIAIVGRSNIAPAAVAGFRSYFMPTAPANPPQVIVNGADPGIFSSAEETEAELDTEWTGAVAPDAAIKLVVSQSTDVTDGSDLSAEYIVDHDLAPVMSSSFSQCEPDLGGPGSSGNLFYQNLYQQAAAEGISVVVAAGDSGSAGCDLDGPGTAAQGLAVSGLASTPYNLAVGGTQFEDASDNWGSTDAPGTLATALGYSPEQAWNESCSVALCGGSIAAGGGGASIVYTKPSWQAGPGVPGDGARDLPDISLAAAENIPYVICTGGPCFDPTNKQVYYNIAAGTSASAQAFAGIMALVDQKTGSAQGLANPELYQLAAAQPVGACNASPPETPAASCIFNDVTAADNDVPCAAGSPNCSSTSGELETANGATAYSAGPGYDLATGWGSVNVTNLVNAWPNAAPAATQTALSLSATQLVHGATPTATITVSGGASGDVVVLANAPVPNAGLVLGNGTLTQGSAVIVLNGLPGGSYGVTAQYVGNDSFASSISPPVNVTVGVESSAVVLSASVEQYLSSALQWTPAGTVPYGSLLEAHALIAGASGVGATDGEVAFQLDGAAIGSIPVNGEGEAALSTPFNDLPIGSHTLDGAYSGDSGLAPSTSPPLALQVVAAPTQTSIGLAVVSPNPNGTQNLSVHVGVTNGQVSTVGTTFGGTVSATDGNGNPLGSVLATGESLSTFGGFVDGGGIIGVPTIPAGPATVIAQYSGDGNFLPSVSAPFALDGGAFHFVANPSSMGVVLTPNATSSTQVSVILDHPLADPTVTLSCVFSVSGTTASCSVSPASVTLTPGAASPVVTLAINTGTQGSLSPAAPHSPSRPLLLGLMGLSLASLLIFVFRRLRRLRLLVPLAWALVPLACGGSPAALPPMSGFPLNGGVVSIQGISGSYTGGLVDTNGLSITVDAVRTIN